MANLETKNYWKKRLVRYFFNEKNYHTIKFIKIILDFKIGKTYEPFINELPNLISPKGIIMDIGANMGQSMMPLAKKFPKSIVLSFEPLPINFKYLCKARNLTRLKNVKCFDIAFSEKSGKEKIVTPYLKGIPVTTRSVLKNSMSYNSNEQIVEQEISTNTIDDFVTKQGIENISFIKIDTEGAEDRVLRGGHNTIRTDKPILQLETSLENPEVKDLLEFGYTAYYYHKKRLLSHDNHLLEGDIFLIYKGIDEGLPQ